MGAAVALAALAAAARPTHADVAEYVLDPEHLTIAFLVDHVGFAKVLGRFGTAEGSFRFDEETGELSDVVVSVDTSTVTTNHRERDRHLVSDDFLNAESHPEMVFTAASARRVAERTFAIDGMLELLGRTQPLTLTATWNKSGPYPFGDEGYALGVSARGRLQRSAFGMSYGVENGWVGDEVEIIVELEARRR